jgi:hypothetical protein
MRLYIEIPITYYSSRYISVLCYIHRLIDLLRTCPIIVAAVKISPSDLTTNSQEILVHNVGIDFLDFFFCFVFMCTAHVYMYVLWSMYVTTYLVSLGDAHVTQNEKNYVFQKKVQYIPVHNMNTNGWGILLSSISRTILTRITSFPENSLCHGLKCVTEGRHKYYINIYKYLPPMRMGNEKKNAASDEPTYIVYTRVDYYPWGHRNRQSSVYVKGKWKSASPKAGVDQKVCRINTIT